MGSKTAVLAVLLVGLASTGQVCAQSASGTPAKTGDSHNASPASTHQPLNLTLAPDAATHNVVAQRDRQISAPQSNQFARMFQDQAENGDARRVPMYLLVPFAKVTPSAGNPTFAADPPANPANQPNVVQDVGALVRTLKAGG
jgi:hypothetical protein